VVLGFFGAWGTFIVFAWRDKAEYEIPVEEVERLDQARRRSKATLLDLPEEALS
jgi:cytochrome o ubiquinol oxidase subunit 1